MSISVSNKRIRCIFLGYLWKVANELARSENIEFIAAGLESQRVRTKEAQDFFEKNNIPWFDAAKIKSNLEFKKMLDEGVDLLVVGAFGQILDREIIKKADGQILNVHTSMLPLYRGGTPIESQILAGDKIGGVTLHWIDEGVDTGPIAIQKAIGLNPDQDSYEVIYEKYHALGADIMKELINLPFDQWPKKAQVGQATSLPPVKEIDFKVNWGKTARELKRMTLACGWKGWVKYYFSQNDVLCLFDVDVLPRPEGKRPGQVFFQDNKICIATSEDAILLKKYQSSRELKKDEILVE